MHAPTHTHTHTRNVGVFYIRPDCTFKIDPIPLTTVRPFVMEAVCHKKTGIPPEEEEKVSAYLTQKVCVCVCVCVCVMCRAVAIRFEAVRLVVRFVSTQRGGGGGGGSAPTQKHFLNLEIMRLLLRPFLDQNDACCHPANRLPHTMNIFI